MLQQAVLQQPALAFVRLPIQLQLAVAVPVAVAVALAAYRYRYSRTRLARTGVSLVLPWGRRCWLPLLLLLLSCCHAAYSIHLFMYLFLVVGS